MQRPHSPSCERNWEPILKVLQEVVLGTETTLLEIGSGTGQHAALLAKHFPHLSWLTSDCEHNHAGIKQWIESESNIQGPVSFEVGKDKFPTGKFDLVFTANTFHIMSWKKVKTLIKLFGEHLAESAQVIIYGPFNYQGKFTSESNEKFEQWLKDRDPQSGIRHFEDIERNFNKHGFKLMSDYEMPANNRVLIFTKLPS